MEAILYEKRDQKTVQCHVCNHKCVIQNNKRGLCGVRENQNGILIALNYGKLAASSIDPIEKKPLYHFMRKTKTYSFATVGCNMECPWCQNHTLSQSSKSYKHVQGITVPPKQIIDTALRYKCPSISYTYSEPTIYLEYALAVMKLAHENGLKNIWVSNGYMSNETLDVILPYLDAANIDFKGPNETYHTYCLGNSDTIIRNMKRMKEYGVHLEVTSLIIPGVNDSDEDLHYMTDVLVNTLGPDTVWHISRYFPHYKMVEQNVTPMETLKRAKQIGTIKGLHYIYLGNV